MSNGQKRTNFTQWQRELDSFIESQVGLDSSCIPGLDLRSAFGAGQSPASYFSAVVKVELEALGFNLDLLEGLEEAAAAARNARAGLIAAAADFF